MDLVSGIDQVGFENNSMYCLFTINVHLTQLGLDNVADVLAAVFGYLRFLKAAGPQERLYRELQVIEENNFRYKTDQTPMDNVEELSINLKYYPTKSLYTADALFLSYDPSGIVAILDAMTDPTTPMNIMLTSRQVFNGHKFDRVEPWFGAEYTIIDFPEGWMEMRTEAPVLTEFALPLPNPYIATDFKILFQKDVTKVTEHPVKVYDTAVGELWFRQDDRFLMPNAYCYFYLTSPVFRGSAEK